MYHSAAKTRVVNQRRGGEDKINEPDRFVLEVNFREEKVQTHATVAKAVGDKVSAAVKKRGGGQQW